MQSHKEKLLRLLQYLKWTKNLSTTLRCDDSNTIKWCVDASFAVHQDFKSHTGAHATLGKGAFIAVSTKQKLNAKSSTEAESVGADDA